MQGRGAGRDEYWCRDEQWVHLHEALAVIDQRGAVVALGDYALPKELTCGVQQLCHSQRVRPGHSHSQ